MIAWPDASANWWSNRDISSAWRSRSWQPSWIITTKQLNISRPPLNKFDEGTTWITSRVGSGSARHTPQVNCILPPRRARGDIETSTVCSVSVGPVAFAARLDEGESTSIASRRGGDIGRVPGERVVVTMLPPSLDRFIDLLGHPSPSWQPACRCYNALFARPPVSYRHPRRQRRLVILAPWLLQKYNKC